MAGDARRRAGRPAALRALAGDAGQEGRVRYLAYGRLRALGDPVVAKVLLGVVVERLFAAAGPIVERIGPWDQARRLPPEAGSLRITFLVSDGRYFGEGPMAVLQRDAWAGPSWVGPWRCCRRSCRWRPVGPPGNWRRRRRGTRW